MPNSATPTAANGRAADPPCPLRPGQLCALCFAGASGPETCGLVYLVMTDPQLRARLEVLREN